jgi:radical SAM protein with 4Fe4S-binding SPASM domain
MVAMKQNLHELPLLVRFAREQGVHSVFVQHLCRDFTEPLLPEQYLPLRRFFAEQSLLSCDEETVARVFRRARETAREAGMELHLPKVRPARQNEPEGCEWPWKGLYVSWRGEIMPCCMVSSADRMSFGTVACDSIPALWNSGVYRDFRESISRRIPPPVCHSCSMYWGMF